jgi:hypothetical protein
MSARTWAKTGPSEYTSNDGHRVYKYSARSGWDTCWGAQFRGSFGDVAGRTKQQAIEYVERHCPPVTDEQFTAALGPCGK